MSIDTALRLQEPERAAGDITTEPVARSDARWLSAGLTAAFIAVVAAYLLALESPLRLYPDSATYLAHALGIPVPPHTQVYPPGYPALLRAAVGLGLGSSSGLVFVNLLFLTVAVVALYRLCRTAMGLTVTGSRLVCLGLLVSPQVVVLAPTPLSDIPYLGLCALCLVALSGAERRTGRARAGLVLLGALLAGAGISVRVAGLALVPPVIYVALGTRRLESARRAIRRHRKLALALSPLLVVFAGAAAVLLAEATSYAHNVAYVWRDIHTLGQLLNRVEVEGNAKLLSLGDLTGSSPRILSALPGSGVMPLLWSVALIGLLAVGCRVRRRFGAIEVFVISTMIVVLLYAGAVARFWLGAWPFMIVYIGLGAERLASSKGLRLVLILALLVFAARGALLLVRSAQLSTSGRAFPTRFARFGGGWSSTVYPVAFGQARLGRKASPEDFVVLAELRRLEPLARARTASLGFDPVIPHGP